MTLVTHTRTEIADRKLLARLAAVRSARFGEVSTTDLRFGLTGRREARPRPPRPAPPVLAPPSEASRTASGASRTTPRARRRRGWAASEAADTRGGGRGHGRGGSDTCVAVCWAASSSCARASRRWGRQGRLRVARGIPADAHPRRGLAARVASRRRADVASRGFALPPNGCLSLGVVAPPRLLARRGWR